MKTLLNLLLTVAMSSTLFLANHQKPKPITENVVREQKPIMERPPVPSSLLSEENGILNLQRVSVIVRKQHMQHRESNVAKQKPVKKLVTQRKVPKLNFTTASWLITFYTSHDAGCGTITANGSHVQDGVTVAAPSGIPFGTKIYIPHVGWRTVTDRGGAIKGHHLDVYVSSVHEAYKLGTLVEPIIIK